MSDGAGNSHEEIDLAAALGADAGVSVQCFTV
jgi:hypothetical protein